MIAVLRRDTDHTLIHTGQNYDHNLSGVFFDDLDLAPPDVFLEAARSTATQTIAAILDGLDRTLRELEVDAVLVLGDTNSGLGLLAAKRLGIPTFHMEAGNRCFDVRVPEELNRRIIDHSADVNLPYSAIAREHLLQEGLPSDRIIVTGSPMPEVLRHYRGVIDSSMIMGNLKLVTDHFYLVSLHREENVEHPADLDRFLKMLNFLAERDDLPIVVSTHPRTRKGLDVAATHPHSRIQFLPPMRFSDFVHLQMNARVVLSDSGTISEESSILGFKALNLRESHERPEAMEHASVMFIGSSTERLGQSLEILSHQGRDTSSSITTPRDYREINVAEKISRILHSYVDVVRRGYRRSG